MRSLIDKISAAWLIRFRQIHKPWSSTGSSLVEFAIVIPVVISILIAFWDVQIRALTQQQHEATMVTVLGNYIEAPIKIISDSASGEVTTQALDDANADVYLAALTSSIEDKLNDLMTGSTHYTNAVGAELWYLTIDPASGNATDANRAGTALYNTASCFTLSDQTAFADYISAATAKILANDSSTPIGTRVYSITWDGVSSAPYAELKAVLFISICSNPPSVYDSRTLITTRVLFPPKEFGL